VFDRCQKAAKLKGYGSINCLDPKNVGLIFPLVWIFGAYIDSVQATHMRLKSSKASFSNFAIFAGVKLAFVDISGCYSSMG
jgi:hypothetical protein